MKITFLCVALFFASAAMAQTKDALQERLTAGWLGGQCARLASTVGDDYSPEVFMDNKTTVCLYTIVASEQAIDVSSLSQDGITRLHIDDSMTYGQLIKIFVRYVTAHPEYESWSSFIVFLAALRASKVLYSEPLPKPAKRTQ